MWKVRYNNKNVSQLLYDRMIVLWNLGHRDSQLISTLRNCSTLTNFVKYPMSHWYAKSQHLGDLTLQCGKKMHEIWNFENLLKSASYRPEIWTCWLACWGIRIGVFGVFFVFERQLMAELEDFQSTGRSQNPVVIRNS